MSFSWALSVFLSSALIFILATPTQTLAQDDDYLKALEEEASASAKVKTKPQTKASKKNLAFQERFEKILENERPATYRFYVKLSADAKSSVLKVYTKSKKISTASKKVFDLYFKQMKQ